MGDVSRIIDIPTHTFDDVDAIVQKWTDRFQTPNGSWTLNPCQAKMLEYLSWDDLPGAVGALGVGSGKTLIAQLAGEAAGVDTSLILAPASLRDEGLDEWETYTNHFDVPPPTYRSYTAVSRNVGLLDEIDPDLIVADECHKLANRSSARTKRFIRYVFDNPEIMFVPMSGTITDSSLDQYRHLVLLALREGAPMPDKFSTFRFFQEAIDSNPPSPPSSRTFARVGPMIDEFYDGDEDETLKFKARRAFRRRFEQTPGVVVSLNASCDKPIHIERVEPTSVPDEIDEALADSRDIWELPGGEEIVDPLRRTAKAKQLGQGFYYRFDWPEGEPDYEWLDVKRRFESRVRKYTKRAKPGRDTRGLVVQALKDGEIHLPIWDEYKQWLDYDEPPREAVWMSDYLIDDAIERAEPGTLIWYSHKAVGRRLAEKIPTAMAGEAVPRDAEIAAVSVDSHSNGLNLQHDFNRNIVLCPPSNGGRFEQLIGRTHRTGQPADEVVVEIYTHFDEYESSLDSAIQDAKYMKQKLGFEHRLLIGGQS